jgi:hypothetical protein
MVSVFVNVYLYNPACYFYKVYYANYLQEQKHNNNTIITTIFVSTIWILVTFCLLNLNLILLIHIIQSLAYTIKLMFDSSEYSQFITCRSESTAYLTQKQSLESHLADLVH